MTKVTRRTNNQSGQTLIIVFVTLGVVLFTVLSTIAGAQIYFQNSTHSIDSEKATALAEAGLDKAVAAINITGGSYNGETETILGDGSYSVKITSKDAGTKIIESTGYLPNKTSPKLKRTVKIEASKGVGVAFVYGIQVGEGGLALGSNNQVKGSIYSNGNVEAVEHNNVTGDIWIAGGPAGSTDQQTDCTGINCSDYLFGKTIYGETRLDLAQSFKPSISAPLNKIALKVKKIGNPPDLAIKILADNGGKPDKNNIITGGHLYSSLVTAYYGWIDIVFETSPNLVADTTYWIVADTSSDSNNYWSWQNDLAQSYNRGAPLYSDNWSAKDPAWNQITGGGDLSFRLTLGGGITSVLGGKDFTVGGDVHAHNIVNSTITKDAYFQTIGNSTAAHYYPGSADPAPKVFPISDANVEDWKAQAEAAGVTTGDVNGCVSTLGPGKIVGNLNFDPSNKCTVTIKSPIWITGSFSADNKNTFKLDPSYGATSGVIIVDGLVDMDNTNHFDGTGVSPSILMLLSTYDSRSNGISAIKIKNNGNTGVFYANKGIIEPGNNNKFKELTGWGIKLVNNSTIDYETGLSSTLFSSGPTGSYTIIKGTYQVK